MKRPSIIAMLIGLGLRPLAVQADLPKGIESFEQHRWMDSIREFIDVLRQDPRNTQAHEYLALAIRQLNAQKAAQVHDHRLQLLENASRRLEDNHLDATLLRQSISDTTQAEENVRQEHWHTQCQMAAMEDRLGHLEAANDLVLRVLAEDGNNAEAQRMLSDLQSQIHETLDTNINLSSIERAVLEGFYAYGQADFRTAAFAWVKARAELEKALSPNDVAAQVSAFHFETYEKVAQAHVDEEDRATRTQTLFAQGTDLFQKKSFAEALERFRQVALINPEYPQLGNYLVQSVAATEKERTRRLSQDMRERASAAFERGLAALEKNQYAEAKQAFQEVLSEDPSHPQARSYLSVIETEMSRRYDPHAAQLHYEAGLVSYASGKLPDAMREWRIATRLDPAHEKAASALSKVQKEITRNQEVPG